MLHMIHGTNTAAGQLLTIAAPYCPSTRFSATPRGLFTFFIRMLSFSWDLTRVGLGEAVETVVCPIYLATPVSDLGTPLPQRRPTLLICRWFLLTYV